MTVAAAVVSSLRDTESDNSDRRTIISVKTAGVFQFYLIIMVGPTFLNFQRFLHVSKRRDSKESGDPSKTFLQLKFLTVFAFQSTFSLQIRFRTQKLVHCV